MWIHCILKTVCLSVFFLSIQKCTFCTLLLEQIIAVGLRSSNQFCINWLFYKLKGSDKNVNISLRVTQHVGISRVLLSRTRCEAPRLRLENECGKKSLVFNTGETCKKWPLTINVRGQFYNSIAGGVIVQVLQCI